MEEYKPVDMDGNPLPDPITMTVECDNAACGEHRNRIVIETYPDSRIVCGTCGTQISEPT